MNRFVRAEEGDNNSVIYYDEDGNKLIRYWKSYEGQPVDEASTRSWRNNNPGNLLIGPFARENGAIGEAGKVPNKKNDAFIFFSSSSYEQAVKNIVSEKPTLFIFNNMLNVLRADDGWRTLESAWDRLRTGDYLVISGISLEQLEKRFKKPVQNSGIVEFHLNNSFYKSALAPEFSNFLKDKLKGCHVITKETFTRESMQNPSFIIKMKGYRLLALRKQ